MSTPEEILDEVDRKYREELQKGIGELGPREREMVEFLARQMALDISSQASRLASFSQVLASARIAEEQIVDPEAPEPEAEPSDSEVWLDAWCAVASSDNCYETYAAIRWADRCLKDFRKRFRRDSQEASD